MTRSKFSIKATLLASGIGLSMAAFPGSQPAAAQSYSDEYSCPAGYVYDPTYGCTLPGDAYEPYDYGYYGCVHQIEMSQFLPFRNVTFDWGRAAGGRGALRSTAPDRRARHRRLKPHPLF